MHEADRPWIAALGGLMPAALAEARERPGRAGIGWVLPSGWQVRVTVRAGTGRAGVRLRALNTPELTRYDFVSHALRLAGELGLSGWPTRSDPTANKLFHEVVFVEPKPSPCALEEKALASEP